MKRAKGGRGRSAALREIAQIEGLDIEFVEFFFVWATEVMDWEIPDVHYDIISFLADIDQWDDRVAVLQVWRGAAKSTIVALFLVWLLVRDPQLRILVRSADDETATRMVRDCRNIIERHPLTQQLRPDDQTWREHTFSVRGASDARNHSVTAKGIMSNVTSMRADVIVFDDAEVSSNANTPGARKQLRNEISESLNLLIPVTGRVLFVGTPHVTQTIYNQADGTDDGGAVSPHASRLTVPVFKDTKGEYPNITGVSMWPTRFTVEYLLQIQKQQPKGRFLSQFMLIPTQAEEAYLDTDQLRVYQSHIKFGYANMTAFASIDDVRLISVTSWWDPSGAKGKDDSVFAIVFADAKGHYWIPRLEKLSGSIDEQAQRVRDVAIEFELPIINVETNTIGYWAADVLLRECRGYDIGVNGIHVIKNKQLRIIEGFEGPLSSGAVHIHESVLETPFVQQLTDFSPNGQARSGHDDFIDAPASAILEQPIRIGKGGTIGDRERMRWAETINNDQIQLDSVSF